MPSKVEQMRDSLLLAIEQVKAGTLPADRAKAMAALAHQVNASLDVELRVLIAAKTQGAIGHLVAEAPPAPPALAVDPPIKAIASGIVERGNGVTRHTIGD